MCVSGLIRTIKTQRLVIVMYQNSLKPTSRSWTHRKDQTASRDRTRDNREPKTIAQVAQEAGFSAEAGKSQSFVTSPSRKNEGTCTLFSREYTLLRSDPNSQLVRALCDNVHIGPVLDTKTTNLGRITFFWNPGAIEKRISTVVHGYSSVEGLNQHASQRLSFGALRR